MKVVNPTSGPWQVEEHAPLRDGQHFLEVATPPTLPDGGYPMLICTVQPTAVDGSRGPDPEQTANAKLIASAPEMLTLLRDLTLAAWRFHDDTGHKNGGSIQCDWICEAMEPAKAFLEERGMWPSATVSSTEDGES